MPCPVSSGYLVYFTRPMTMHRAVSPMEPTPRWVPCVVFEMCCCHGQESRKIPGPTLELLLSSVSCALSAESLGPYATGPQQRLLSRQWHHCWQLGLVEMSVWACGIFWWEKPLKVYSLFSRSLSALSAYHSGLITPMKIRTETPGNLRLYSGSPTRSEKEQVSISSFYYKERVSTRPKHCSQPFSFHDLFSFHLALLVTEALYSSQKDIFLQAALSNGFISY